MNFLTELQEGLAISWDALLANKMRSGLTALGIVIGITTVTLMSAAIDGLNTAFLKSISAIGTDVLYIQKYAWFSDEPWWKVRNRREIWLADGRAFLRQANPAWKICLESVSIRTLNYKDLMATGVVLVGDTEEAAVVSGLNLSEGRFLTAAEVDGGRPVCVIGADLARSFFSHIPAVGHKIKIDDAPFEVIGVIEKRGKFLGLENLDNTCYVPITRFSTGFIFRPGIRITIKTGNVANVGDATEEIRGIMRKVRRLAPADPDDFAINSQEAFITAFKRMSNVIASIGLFITGLSLFVGGIGITNIMLISVAERTREIGICKAIGARRRTILIQFLIEASTICLIGGVIGLAIAFPISEVMARRLPASISMTVAGLALGVSVLTGVIAGFFPAWRAARMNPVDALRNE